MQLNNAKVWKIDLKCENRLKFSNLEFKKLLSEKILLRRRIISKMYKKCVKKIINLDDKS